MTTSLKKYFLCAIFTLGFLAKNYNASAQLVVDSVPTAAQIIASLQGPGVTITNLNINCHREAYGTFTATGTNLGLPAGLLLTSGYASYAVGPNPYPSINSQGWGTTSSDSNLTSIINYSTSGVAVHDACIMTFDITPSCDSLALDFVFGSEEYPDFVGEFNDGFGFWVSGPNPSGGNYNNKNIALVPSTTIPVTINNVNDGNSNTGPCVNCAYYVNNIGGLTIAYNAFTTPLTAYIHVVPCQVYHMEIGIADAGDDAYDSGVFLQKQGFRCTNSVTVVSPHDTTICAGQPVPLTASGTGNYTWGPPIGLSGTTGSNVTATPTVTTTYTVTGYSTTSCGVFATSDSVTIMVGVPGFSITTSSPSVCIGDSVKLTASSGAVSYSWAPGTGLSSTSGSVVYAKPATTTTYTVTGTASGGCSSTATVLITVNPPPTITVNSPTICTGTSATLTGVGGTTYSWSTGATSNPLIVNPATTTSYTVIGTDANGCTNSSIATVTVTPSPTITVSGNITICQGSNTTLTASGVSTYSWSTGATTSTVTVSPSNTTTYTVTGSNGGCSGSATVTVTVDPKPVIDSLAALFPPLCKGTVGSITGIIVNSGTTPYTYSWNPTGQTTANATGLSAGSYTLTVTDADGCTSTSGPYTITNSLVTANFTANPTSGMVPLSVNFTNTSTGANSYEWYLGNGDTTNASNPSTIYGSMGTYNVELIATNSNGCKDTAYGTIDVFGESMLIIPNVFSPNGDGKNDVFIVKSNNIASFDGQIFDRWGIKLFEWNNVNEGWNGDTKSGEAPSGTYYYLINATGTDGKQYQEKGYLTLIR